MFPKNSVCLSIRAGLLSLSIFCLSSRLPVTAQTVTSDATVGTNVIDSGNFTITGGTQQLTTLFHSFRDFSPETANVTFQLGTNQAAVDTVIGRVTGGNVSIINGQLGLTGGNLPDLFLLNPNGIIFGANAQLNLPSSFMASTAESVLFANDAEFSASSPGAAPLLTMSTPIGLNMGQTPAAITVHGTGHGLTNRRLPFSGSVGNVQLSVTPNNSLALVGGPITFNGGILDSEATQIELGAIGDNATDQIVQLDATADSWVFDYDGVSEFASIQLLDRAIVATRGVSPGNINLVGANLDVTEGSLALVENQGDTQAGDLIVQVDDTVTVSGFSSSPEFSFSSLANYTASNGQAGDLKIEARQLLVRDRAEIRSSTADVGSGGAVILRIADLVQLDNSILDSTGGVEGSAGIFASTFGSGDAGLIDLVTRQIKLSPGAFIATSTFFGGGRSGDIQISATESIELLGTVDNVSDSAIITVTSYGAGDAGNLEINTPRLVVKGGGSIGGANFSSGQGGTITVNASESIEITGQRTIDNLFDGIVSSQLSVSSRVLRPGRPAPSGDSGSMVITTPLLELDNNGQILLTNEGTGDGGELVINADRISLKGQSDILGSTTSGNGGSIELNLSEALLIRENSLISAEADGISSTGNGGNIMISAPVILGLEDSDIVASAVQGNGGNISIITQGILGLVPRAQLTSENDITASSEFGVDGSVEVTNFGNEIITSLLELPENLEDRSRQIAQACDTGINAFRILGRGGIPEQPLDTLTGSAVWTDLRSLSGNSLKTATLTNPDVNPLDETEFSEANGISLNEKGEIILTASSVSNTAMETPTTCSTLSAHGVME